MWYRTLMTSTTLSDCPTTHACECASGCSTGETVQIGFVTVTRFYCDTCGGFTSETVSHECQRRMTSTGRVRWSEFFDGEPIKNVVVL